MVGSQLRGRELSKELSMRASEAQKERSAGDPCAGLRPWAHWAALALTAGSTRLSQVMMLRNGGMARFVSQVE